MSSDQQRNRLIVLESGTDLARLAAEHWTAQVPTCPGWDLGALVAHLGRSHRWAVANLTAGRRVHLREIDQAPDAQAERLAWYREGLEQLGAAIERTDPDAEIWAFGASGEHRAWWWFRRMAHETALHRYDAELAAGIEPTPLEPSFSAGGIDEYLVDLLPRLPAERFAGRHGILHVHATDAPGEWMLDFDQPPQPARREHVKADTAVRGPAADLLLWLWGRRPVDGLEVFGDAGAVADWSSLAI